MGQKQGFRRPAGVKVTYRRMKFDFEDGFDRYWHGGSPFRSLFWTQMSTAFAPGEKFFIDSARALKDMTDDPELLEEIAEFCRQEGHHTAQHLKFDRINAQMGIDVDGCRKRYEWMLARARRKLDPMEMLAATSALEHFTAGLADIMLSRPDTVEGADPRVAALWTWHAVEEAEHRATCFDLYRQLGGNYFQRVVTMVGAWFLIVAFALVNTVSLLRKDNQLWTMDTLRGIRYLFGFRGQLTSLLPCYFAYFNPRFHPWRGTDSTTIARWQADNARYIQNLKEMQKVSA